MDSVTVRSPVARLSMAGGAATAATLAGQLVKGAICDQQKLRERNTATLSTQWLWLAASKPHTHEWT